jgi:Flp pilus assembly protein TadG
MMSVVTRFCSNSWAFAARKSRMNYTSQWRAESGQSLIEFALVLPVLMLTVLGSMTFGIAINNYMLLTNATDTGGRALAISRGQTLDPCQTGSSAAIAAAPLLKSANLTFKFTLNGTAYTGTSCSSSSITSGAAANLAQGSTATMHVSYPCSLNLYGQSVTSTCTLNAQTSELVQ